MPEPIHVLRARVAERGRELADALDKPEEHDLGALTDAVEAAERVLKAAEAAERARAGAEPRPGHHGEPEDSLAEALTETAQRGGNVRLGSALHGAAELQAERALSTSTDSDLVPASVAAQFLSHMRRASGIVSLSNAHVVPDGGGGSVTIPTIGEVLVAQTAEGSEPTELSGIGGTNVALARHAGFLDVSFAMIQSSPLAAVEGVAMRLMNAVGLAAEALIVDAVVPAASGATAVSTAGSVTTAELFARFAAIDPFRVEGGPESESRAAWIASTGAYSAMADDAVGTSDARPLYGTSWAERPAARLFGLPVYRATRKGASAWGHDFTGSSDVPLVVADLAEAHHAMHEPILTVDTISRASSGEVRVSLNANLAGIWAGASTARSALKGA